MDSITQEILLLVKKRMREQGAYNHEAYKEMINDAIQYFQEKGKLTDQDNLSFIKEELMQMWEQVERKITN